MLEVPEPPEPLQQTEPPTTGPNLTPQSKVPSLESIIHSLYSFTIFDPFKEREEEEESEESEEEMKFNKEEEEESEEELLSITSEFLIFLCVYNNAFKPS